MKKITKISLFALLFCAINANGVFAQISWNPENWETITTGAVITPNAANNDFTVANLQNGKRADLRYKMPFSLSSNSSFLALRLKAYNGAPYVAGNNDAFKIEVIHQYYEQGETEIEQKGFNVNNRQANKRVDTDNDGVDDLFIWNLENVLGSNFQDDYEIPYALNWTDGTNVGSYRAWLKFTIILNLDAEASEAAYYEVTDFSTYATEEDAIKGGLTTGLDNISKENGFYFSSNGGVLTIHSDIEKKINIHNIDGRIVKQAFSINKGINLIDFLSKGFYIIENQKVIIE